MGVGPSKRKERVFKQRDRLWKGKTNKQTDKQTGGGGPKAIYSILSDYQYYQIKDRWKCFSIRLEKYKGTRLCIVSLGPIKVFDNPFVSEIISVKYEYDHSSPRIKTHQRFPVDFWKVKFKFWNSTEGSVNWLLPPRRQVPQALLFCLSTNSIGLLVITPQKRDFKSPAHTRFSEYSLVLTYLMNLYFSFKINLRYHLL